MSVPEPGLRFGVFHGPMYKHQLPFLPRLTIIIYTLLKLHLYIGRFVV